VDDHSVKKERKKMIRKTILTAMLVALGVATASAQEPRVELGVTAGWTFSDGVSGSAADSSAVRVDPKDAFSWGIRLGLMASPNVEIGGLFDMQKTDLEASGIINRSVPQTINNYHGYVAYNFGEADAKARPYFLGGLGATQYGALKTSVGDVGGQTKFSTTWALGVKINPSRNVGIRLETRWTPTYIKSDAAGYWCDPYWGCYTVADAQYANQFEISGGLTLRF
jgi:opacity protein-like surface antigen